MNKNEAMQHGLGYAAGREDASGVLTIARERWQSGFIAFAQAYAQGWDDFSRQYRCSMTSCRDAYDRWQESGGRSIFREGDLTLGEDQRAELGRLRPGAFASTGEFIAYLQLHGQMQADAWAALMAGSTS